MRLRTNLRFKGSFKKPNEKRAYNQPQGRLDDLDLRPAINVGSNRRPPPREKTMACREGTPARGNTGRNGITIIIV